MLSLCYYSTELLATIFTRKMVSNQEKQNINWASEANPTLGCLIKISCDIYVYTIVTMEIAM